MDKQQQEQQQIDTPTTNNWTTREELLLSYAVKRYGFSDWDTVAVQIQSRSALPQIFTSPHHCKLKFLELKRRFRQINDNDEDEHEDDADVVPWLEDLRNLRIEELRREVLRYDDSILSLQMKVKRLEEERERSVEMNGNNDERKPDLQKINDENGSENDKNEHDGEVPGIVAGEPDLDQEKQLSVNESNSTGLKDENRQTGLNDNDDDMNKVVQEGDRSVTKKPDSEAIKEIKPECGGVNSCDESSESVARRLGVTPEADQNKPGLTNNNNSYGSRNSESESERANAERSDVQSSASLTVKTRRSCDGAGEEFEWGRSFGAMKQVMVKSQPLVKLLELIRSHKRGPLFERRLDSQVSDKYKDVVRQHMDLQKIQKRLDQGAYSSCSSRFFRDLLLLFNNAIVFFPKSSAEFIAATELQKLVVTEMSKETQRSDYSPEASLTPHSQVQSKSVPEKPESLLDSQKSSAPIIVCRKRSSIHSKSTPDSNKQKGLENEEKKTSFEVKSTSGNSNIQEQQSLTNTDKKDRIVTGTRSFRRNNSNLKTSAAPLKKQRNASTDVDIKDAPKIEKNNKKEKEVQTSVKKRGAADFLKRIKGSSVLDKSKGTTADDSKNTRQNSSAADGRKDKIILRQKPATKEDISSSSKRNAGGPVKKPIEPVPGKRKKEPEPSSSKRPQKRNRR